jgi:hypothetical protein
MGKLRKNTLIATTTDVVDAKRRSPINPAKTASAIAAPEA